jgi:hypothetical protein
MLLRRLLLVSALAPLTAHHVHAQVVKSPREWTFSLEGDHGRDSNLRFQTPDDSGDVVTHLSGRLVGALQGQRGRFALSVGGGATEFRQMTRFNTFTYELGLEAKRELTLRWTAHLFGQARSVLSSLAVPSEVSQPLLPLSLSRSQTAGAGTAYRFSTRTTGTVEASYTRVTFDSPLLIGGWTTGGNASLDHLYSPGQSVGAVYGFEENSTFGVRVGVHTLFGRWQPTAGFLGARFLAGAMRIDPLDGIPARVKPAGSAALFSRLAAGVLALQYRRSAEQAFGLGRMLLSDHVSMAYDREGFLGNTIHLAIDRSWSRNPSDESVAFVNTSGTLQLRRTLLGGFFVGGDVSVRRRDENVIVRGNTMRVLFGFTRSGQ